jgi:hypothetical protein
MRKRKSYENISSRIKSQDTEMCCGMKSFQFCYWLTIPAPDELFSVTIFSTFLL